MSNIKILKIIVNELPTNCGDCFFRNDNYCNVKGAAIESGQMWINKHEDNRNPYCPLKTPFNFSNIDFSQKYKIKWIENDNSNHNTETDNKIYYGQDEDGIHTKEGKERLWDEERILFIGGVHAFKVINRENTTPLIKLYIEDDGCLSPTDVVFDSSWLKKLQKLINVALNKLE